MSNTTPKKTDQKMIKKSLKYYVVVKYVNFDPGKYRSDSRIIIVDGALALRIGGRVYTKI